MPGVARVSATQAWRRATSDFPRAVGLGSRGLWCGTADGTLAALDASSGAVRFERSLGSGVLCAREHVPTGRLAVSCEDGTTHLIEPSGKTVATLPSARRGAVEWLAWSRTRLATAQGRTARVWTLEGDPVLETPDHESTLSGVAFSNDGETLITSCYGGVRLFPLSAGAPARHLPWKSSLLALTPSPNGAVIAAATQDNAVHFWRLESGKDSEMSGFPRKPTQLAWSSDSRLLASGGSEVVCLWTFEGRGPEGKPPFELHGHRAPLCQLVFSPHEVLLVSASLDGDVRFWRPDVSPKSVGLVSAADEVTELCVSPDARQLVVATTNELTAFALAST